MKEWLGQLASLVNGRSTTSRKQKSKAPKRKRLEFDVLEDRCVPTVYVVNTNLDVVAADGKLSLREAIQAANTNAVVNEAPAGSAVTTDHIFFAPSLAGKTITLNGTELLITESLTITGLGANQLTISGNNASRIFEIDGSSGNTKVSLSDLTLTKGATSGRNQGAGIFSNSFNGNDSLTIQRCVLTQNTSGAEGGAIELRGFSGGTRPALTIQDSTISGNIAGGEGSGINFEGGQLSIARTTVANNKEVGLTEQGGGLAVRQVTGTISSSTFSGNITGGEGGGIAIQNNSTITLQNTTISGNTSGRDGGGLYVGYYSTATLKNCTITRNHSTSGQGGGINSPGTTNIHNTIVEGNSDSAGQHDLALGFGGSNGTFNARFSLIQSPNGQINGTNTKNITGVSANLGPLQFNGGPTMTHALLKGSKAINAGSNALAPASLYDQRGLGFARIVNGLIDIGAFEVQPPPATTGIVGRRWNR
jgi:hypothetical protein